MSRVTAVFVSIASFLALHTAALNADSAEERLDVSPGIPFSEGDLISHDDISRLRDYLPPEFWEHREYFFYEGMELEIGPFYREYGAAKAYDAATARFDGESRIGRDGALEDYTAGQPFQGDIDCAADPHAGIKIIWNFQRAWSGDGGRSTWSYTYWDRGEQLPLYYEGVAKAILLKHRVEPQYLQDNGGDIFSNEKRLVAFGIEIEAPFDARGISILSYRYKAADGPLDQAKNDDTWFYIPDLRRVRRMSSAQRTDSVAGTDFTMDDLRSFAGIPPQYSWECLGERDVLSPFNSKHLAYPYSTDYNFGPYGFSFANDRWELRHAYLIRFDPKNPDHPYDHKDLYIDRETFEPLYSFAYDRKKELWKIIWHNHRYSADWAGSDPRAKEGIWYRGWAEVEDPRDLRTVSDIIVNVQTGTGNRIEAWDNHGTPYASKGKIRRYIDIGRLNKGR